MRLILLLLIAVPCFGQTFVSSTSCTAFPCTVTSTGAGHLGVAITDRSVEPTAITIGSQAMTQSFTTDTTNFNGFQTISKLDVWVTANLTGSQTSLTCTTGCTGSTFAVHWYEFSGMITSSDAAVLDWMSFGVNPGTGALSAYFTPSTAHEAVVTASNCSGTASSYSGSTWSNAQFPSGEGAAELTTSAIGLVTSTVNTGCDSGSGMGTLIVGFRASGGTGTTCSWTFAEEWGEPVVSGTSVSVSNVQVHRSGDLIVLYPWCNTTCTTAAPTIGSDTGTLGVTAPGSNTSGQPYLYYILSSSAAGKKTMAWSPTGSPTQVQLYMQEYTPNPSCPAAQHDVSASGTGTLSGSTSLTSPSITATAGDLEVNFTAVSIHAISPIGSPWSCVVFQQGTTPSQDCTTKLTVNIMGFITSASGSSTSNNVTTNSIGADWQVVMDSYKFASAAATLPQVFVIHP